jgi:hypothetical protein
VNDKAPPNPCVAVLRMLAESADPLIADWANALLSVDAAGQSVRGTIQDKRE